MFNLWRPLFLVLTRLHHRSLSFVLTKADMPEEESCCIIALHLSHALSIRLPTFFLIASSPSSSTCSSPLPPLSVSSPSQLSNASHSHMSLTTSTTLQPSTSTASTPIHHNIHTHIPLIQCKHELKLASTNQIQNTISWHSPNPLQ